MGKIKVYSRNLVKKTIKFRLREPMWASVSAFDNSWVFFTSCPRKQCTSALISDDQQRIMRSCGDDIIFIHTCTFYNSRLLLLSRKSNIPMVTMPDSSLRIFILSRTRMIFLNESLTFWNGRLSCASFSGVAKLNADCK